MMYHSLECPQRFVFKNGLSFLNEFTMSKRLYANTAYRIPIYSVRIVIVPRLFRGCSEGFRADSSDDVFFVEMTNDCIGLTSLRLMLMCVCVCNNDCIGLTSLRLMLMCVCVK